MKLLTLLSGSLALFQQLAVALEPTKVVRTTSSSSSESSPNPIASLYPDQITGTINSTIAVVPIPYDLARSIIPEQYGILTEAYYSLLKGFPKNSYPLIIRAALDHDVGVYAFGFSLADFQKFQILYPFVDLLGDGYSSFTYNKYLLLSSNNTIAITGAEADGTTVPPTTFDPDLQAYAFARTAASKTDYIYFNAYTNLSSTRPAASTIFKSLEVLGPWPLSFYKNVTNQPIFSNGSTCDNQITLFNTSLSTGKNAPVGIRGRITIMPPYFPEADCAAFDDVYGIKLDTAFVETPSLPCATLKGYHGTGGSGD